MVDVVDEVNVVVGAKASNEELIGNTCAGVCGSFDGVGASNAGKDEDDVDEDDEVGRDTGIGALEGLMKEDISKSSSLLGGMSVITAAVEEGLEKAFITLPPMAALLRIWADLGFISRSSSAKLSSFLVVIELGLGIEAAGPVFMGTVAGLEGKGEGGTNDG